jgi:hypothetical protein
LRRASKGGAPGERRFAGDAEAAGQEEKQEDGR